MVSSDLLLYQINVKCNKFSHTLFTKIFHCLKSCGGFSDRCFFVVVVFVFNVLSNFRWLLIKWAFQWLEGSRPGHTVWDSYFNNFSKLQVFTMWFLILLQGVMRFSSINKMDRHGLKKKHKLFFFFPELVIITYGVSSGWQVTQPTSACVMGMKFC